MPPKEKKSEEPPWFRNHNCFRYKLQREVSRLTNGFIKSPFYIRSLNYHQSKDNEVRQKSKIDQDQTAHFWSVTSVEYFTPEFIKNLEKGLGNLKASRGHWSEETLASYVRNYRGSVGSSFEVYLEKPSSDSFTSLGHLSELPQFCSSARGSVLNLTPSLSALVVTFFISERDRKTLNDELHRTYAVRLETLPKGAIRAHESKTQQRSKVEAFRKRLRFQIDSWFNAYCPGVYAVPNRERPVCFTVSTGSIVPFFSESAERSILDPLDLRYSPYIFRSEKTSGDLKQDGVFFSPSVFDSDRNFSHICGTDAAFGRLASESWGNDPTARYHYLDDVTRRTFGVWWCTDLLRVFRRQAVGVRDKMRQTINSNFPMTALTSLQKEMAMVSEGATIAKDLKTYLKRSSLYFFEFDAFLFDRHENVDQKSIKKVFEKSIKFECKLTDKELDELHNHIISQTNIASSRQSLKLQYFVIILSIIVILISVVSIFLTGQGN